jgi:hypothetical protein
VTPIRCSVAALAVLAALAMGGPALAQVRQSPLDAAALQWLSLLDAGHFEEAWRQGGELLHEDVSEAEWIAATEHLRSAFGTVASRQLAERNFHVQLAGAPDGKYFTLMFRTAFTGGGGQEIELVTLAADPKGAWRVIAYGLKR